MDGGTNEWNREFEAVEFKFLRAAVTSFHDEILLTSQTALLFQL